MRRSTESLHEFNF